MLRQPSIPEIPSREAACQARDWRLFRYTPCARIGPLNAGRALSRS